MRYRHLLAAAALLAMSSPAPLFAEDEAEAEVEAAEAQPQAEEAAGIDEAEPGFFEDWNVSLSIGFSGTKGNTRAQNLNAQFRADKETDRDRWLWNNKYFYGRSEGETDQENFSSRLTKDWLKPNEQWFVFARGAYEYDRFRPFEHRLSGFGGAGYDFIREDDLAVTGRAGAGLTRDWGEVNDTRPEGLIGLELLRWHITEHQTLSASSTLYPNLEDLPRNRVVSDIEWTVSLADADGLSLKFGAEHEYQSRTEGGADHHDLKYYGALQYDF